MAGEKVRKMKQNPILKFKKVLVVDENGVNLGEMESKVALGLAEGKDMKIAKVSLTLEKDQDSDKAPTPVFRIVSGRTLYEEQRSERKKARSSVEIIKEVHIGTKITDRDMDIKIKHIQEVLEKGKSVRVYGEVKAKGKWIQPEEYQLELDKRVEKLDFVANSLEGFGELARDPKAKGSKEFVLFRPTPDMIEKKEKRVKESVAALKEKRRRRKMTEPVNEQFLEVMGKELEKEMAMEEEYDSINISSSSTEDSVNFVGATGTTVDSNSEVESIKGSENSTESLDCPKTTNN